MITPFLLTILIVGFVTAGLKIRFDRFFTILLLMFLFRFSIFDSVNIFLWIIMLGALMILLENREKLTSLPKKMKIQLFVIIPVLTLGASFAGSLLFRLNAETAMLITLGIIAIAYGLRLILIHFRKHEMDYKEPVPAVAKFCALFGPILSGFAVGLIGTSLKPLKIPFALRIGKMNLKQVYLGNTVTTFFASIFALMWHALLSPSFSAEVFYSQMLLGAALWTGIHYISEITNMMFKDTWRKIFQIIIGVILLAASLKVFVMV
jgi:uncharacterized membrane protein YfcA